MKFQLWMQNSSPYCLEVTRGEDAQRVLASVTLLAERDPEIVIQFQSGTLYFNPLFKTLGGPLHPFLVNGENELVSVFSGRPPKKFKRVLREQVSRGWFELAPRSISLEEIPVEVHSLITNTPRLKGVIAQVTASTMGLRIPEEFVPQSSDEWRAWFTAQPVLLPPRMRQAFTTVSSRNQNLILPVDVAEELRTGIIPEKIWPIKIRWFEQRRIKIVQDQIFESQEWNLEVPESILKGGEEAILKFADEKFGPGWRTPESYPVANDKILEEIEPLKVAGPLIWVRTVTGKSFVLLNPTNADRPKTINDLLQQAINP